MECKNTKRLYHWDQKSLIIDIQKLLQVEESMISKEKLTVEDLESSAKMFIYLITCSDDLRSLYTFYKNMFLKSPDLILLTLNRIMKLEGDTSPNKDLKLLSSKILQKVIQILRPQYKGYNYKGESYETIIFLIMSVSFKRSFFRPLQCFSSCSYPWQKFQLFSFSFYSFL